MRLLNLVKYDGLHTGAIELPNERPLRDAVDIYSRRLLSFLSVSGIGLIPLAIMVLLAKSEAIIRWLVALPNASILNTFVVLLALLGMIAGLGYAAGQTRKLEKARLEVEKARLEGMFFTKVSHEFRTPLMLLIGPLTRILEGEYGQVSEPLRKQHEMMLRNSERLQRLIDQILDLSKLEAGHLNTEVRRHDLARFVEKTVQAFMPLATAHNIEVRATTPDYPCITSFDVEHMEQILGNLLSNALKYTGSGGLIHVRVQPRDEHIDLIVEDTGRGIPVKKLKHIFDRFYQVDSSATRRHEGAGIGLALVKELVRLNGGKIKAESVEGEGSTFTVSLPVVKGELVFLTTVRRVIEIQLSDPSFTVEKLAAEMGLSYSILYSKLLDESGESPSQLIRTMRLERAAQLLESGATSSIGEVAYAVGFRSLSYFARSFREHFGVTPSEYTRTVRR